MFRKNVLKSETDLINVYNAYRKLSYMPIFKKPDKYPCIMITYIDSENDRLDYQGEVYNCFIDLDTVSEFIKMIKTN